MVAAAGALGAAAASAVVAAASGASAGLAVPLVASVLLAPVLLLPVLGVANGPGGRRLPGACAGLALWHAGVALPVTLVVWLVAHRLGAAEAPALGARAYRLDALLLLVLAAGGAAGLSGRRAKVEGLVRVLVFVGYFATLLVRLRV